ncbi:50S ribosomal protein L30 [Marinitoga aeolica]|uniref:Large ribosomal subunit protein uL30 n=1 Tax=Marinitoga aeolica TaxID=2809031 RepID=A0ABY8PRV7_9BACT|nr:50S ribosomal protein L30 [Marinitoga aeolica]WGS65353.1 50S ribosomal protein L30 [Marinitoga aeolica]
MAKLKIKLIRGRAGKNYRQLATLDALGLRKPNHEVIKEDRPEIRGMITKVQHLVKVEEIEE